MINIFLSPIKKLLFPLLILLFNFAYAEVQYDYKSFKEDPMKMRIYTLKNGLTVYLSKNTDEPRIQTYIAVRAGSNNDPSDNTGLAHYLEHMLFKGSSKLGTSDFKEEKKYLDQISDLYEQHKAEPDSEKRKAIYEQIDKLSKEASKYSIANEYDKITSVLGAQGTNAHTWVNETVYKNDIPANELTTWLMLEKERMSELVLRLFHTELETVYEEFNRGQDNPGRQEFQTIMKGLFPTTNYGLQTTIGNPEHLKLPSMKAIHKYFDEYYVPGNMALVLVGDIDFDKTIKLIDESFGQLPAKPVPEEYKPTEKDFEKIKKVELVNPAPENVSIAYRLPGLESNRDNYYYMNFMDEILSSSAGLFTININLPQKALSVGSNVINLKDYSIHNLQGTPKKGQSLDELKDLMLSELDKIKKGEFDDWLVDAVKKDMKKEYLRSMQSRDVVATLAYNNFINRYSWDDAAQFISKISNITKKDIVDFANKYYANNALILYKKQGEDKNIVHVDKPKITEVDLNRDKESDFYKKLLSVKPDPIQPKFLDFAKDIKKDNLTPNSILYSIDNTENDLASLLYMGKVGKDNDLKLVLAFEYAKYLGTNKYSPAELNKELYKLGINLNWTMLNRKSYISISGLREDVLNGIAFFEDMIKTLKPSQETYDDFVNNILVERANNKNNNRKLFAALETYAKSNKNSRLRDVFSEKELREIDPKELVEKIQHYFDYNHDLFYYGKNVESVKQKILSVHDLGNDKPIPQPKRYKLQDNNNSVYFYSYPQSQANISFINKNDRFDAKDIAISNVFNEYFGIGLSSITFQEIREAKAFAYSASTYYKLAIKKKGYNFLYGSLGTQVDKLPQAINAMQELLNSDIPKSEHLFDNVKQSVLKSLSTVRYNREDIFNRWIALRELGIDHDINQDVYEATKNLTFDDLKEFFDHKIKNQTYNYAIMGDKTRVNLGALKKLGTLTELSSEDLFGY